MSKVHKIVAVVGAEKAKNILKILSFFAFCFHREAFLSLCSLENFVQNLTGMGQIFRLFPQAKHIHLPCFGAILTVNGLFFLCGVFCFDSHEPGLV